MIEFRSGDIFQSNADALVNAVNCVGIMGRGIALTFKASFPENFRLYEAACKRGEVAPGRMFVVPTGSVTSPGWIINFPTKRHWRDKSRLEDIEAGLADLARVLRTTSIHSVAIPALGSGLGGLDWHDVCPRIVAALDQFPDVHVIVFEPGDVH